MDYCLNNIRIRRFSDQYLVTTDHGSMCMLTPDELRRLKRKEISGDLHEKLEKHEIILNEQNAHECVRLLRNRNHFLYRATSLHIVVLTKRCNMSCPYCQSSSLKNEGTDYDMDKDTAKKVVDFIFQSPSSSIRLEFQGGEPLLNFEVLKYMVRYAKEKNESAQKRLAMSMVSNMTEMDSEKLDFLMEENVHICTSFDGPKELHDRNRPYAKGSNYDIVTHWLEKMPTEAAKRNLPPGYLTAIPTITRASLEYPQQIVDEYIHYNLRMLHLRFLHRLGMARSAWKDIGYTPEEFIAFWKETAEYIQSKRAEGVDIRERMTNIMATKFISEYDPCYLDLRSPCGAIIGQMAYDYNGDIFPCDEARMVGEDMFRLGNIHEEISYKELTTCDMSCNIVNASMNDQYICDTCAYKPFCGVCPVYNYVDQGSLGGRVPESDRCKIFMAQFDWVTRKLFIERNLRP